MARRTGSKRTARKAARSAEHLLGERGSLSRQIPGFGWTPDLPDHRDFLYAAPTPILRRIPAKADLRAKCPKEIYDQGQLGSCTGNAIAAAVEFDLMRQRPRKVFTPSRLFIYYNERAIEHTINQDSGAQIRDGIKSVAKLGACPEREWPYDISQFTEKPSSACYTDARKNLVKLYQRLVPDLNTMKGCLADGFPFVFGFTVYKSFMSASVRRTGNVPMPTTAEKSIGGHAVLAVGYDDATRRFTVRNSWGKAWGKGGYFFMPYAYLLDDNLAADFWTIRGIM